MWTICEPSLSSKNYSISGAYLWSSIKPNHIILSSYNSIYNFHISGKSLTELTNKGQLVSSLPTSKSTSILTNIPSQKQIDSIHNQQQPHSNPSTLITSTSVSSNTGTTLVTNELVTTKKVVQTKTISPPVLIQVKQEPASSSSSCGVNQEFTKPHFITPSISSDQLNKNNDGLSKPNLANLVAVKSEALAGQDQRLLNRNDSTNQININGNILKKEGKCDQILFH